MTPPQNDCRVYEPESHWAFQRLETNMAQTTCIPRVALHRLVPPNEKKLYPARLMNVCREHNINVMYGRSI
jgi:hypothetical protein